MPFEPGQKKPHGSGRKKGVGNKFSITSVRNLLESRELEPVAKILELMPDLKPSEQVQVWQWFITYLQPKMTDERYDALLRKLEATSDSSTNQTTNNLIDFIKSN